MGFCSDFSREFIITPQADVWPGAGLLVFHQCLEPLVGAGGEQGGLVLSTSQARLSALKMQPGLRTAVQFSDGSYGTWTL